MHSFPFLLSADLKMCTTENAVKRDIHTVFKEYVVLQSVQERAPHGKRPKFFTLIKTVSDLSSMEIYDQRWQVSILLTSSPQKTPNQQPLTDINLICTSLLLRIYTGQRTLALDVIWVDLEHNTVDAFWLCMWLVDHCCGDVNDEETALECEK